MTTAPVSPPAQVAAAEAEKPYVLIKRGLYWRPDAQGYTGVLAEAGRYSEAKVRGYIDDPRLGVVAMLASEAGEFSPACWEETKLRVMRDRLTAAESERDGAWAIVGSRARENQHLEARLTAALARAERLEKALEAWRPIKSAPRGRDEAGKITACIFVAQYPGHGGWTDPYCGWITAGGEYLRWPHSFPPTHWMPQPGPPSPNPET